jgi:hypothetical protein
MNVTLQKNTIINPRIICKHKNPKTAKAILNKKNSAGMIVLGWYWPIDE